MLTAKTTTARGTRKNGLCLVRVTVAGVTTTDLNCSGERGSFRRSEDS